MRLVTKGKTSTRDCYQLSYSSRNAEPLLRAIIPWLRVKKNEAQFALEFLRTIMSPNRGRAGLPEGVWEKRQGLMEGLRASRGYPRP